MIKEEVLTIAIEYKVIETHPKKSTLECKTIRPGRKVGNSTRQVDLAIDLLYQGYRVVVQDHYADGKSRKANEQLFKKILERLIDHDIAEKAAKNKISIDYKKLEVEFL